MRHDDSRKTWMRVWFVLDDDHLLEYKEAPKHSDAAAGAPLHRHVVKDAVVRYSGMGEQDDFVFAIVRGKDTLQLQAANPVDLQYWVKLLNFARLSSKARLGMNQDKVLEKSGTLFHQGLGHSAWFVLKGGTLSWYEDHSEARRLGQVSLADKLVREHDAGDGGAWFEAAAVGGGGGEDGTELELVLRAAGKEQARSWMAALKKGKVSFWTDTNDLSVDRAAFLQRGYLMKRGQQVKNWQRRWFVLKDTLLLYFKSPKDATPAGEIPVAKAYVRRTMHRNPLRFEIECAHRTFFLEAGSTLDLSLWMKALKVAKLQYWKGKGGEDCREDEDGTSGSGGAGEGQGLEASLRHPDKEGYMMKQGGNVKTWKRRWFVLKGHTLYYFTSAQIRAGDQAGLIPLEGARVVTAGVSAKTPSSFQIVTR